MTKQWMRSCARGVVGLLVVVGLVAATAVSAGGSTGSTTTRGYWMLGADGQVYAFGNLRNYGGVGRVDRPPIIYPKGVQILSMSSGTGYLVLDSRGDIKTYGAASFFGDIHDVPPGFFQPGDTARIAKADEGSYWMFSSRGRVHPFAFAHSYGVLQGVHLNGPIIDAVGTATGHGYYMLGTDGGVFSFGDAHFYGSMGAKHLNQPVVGIVPTPTNRGYWLVASDGGVFAFGDAKFRGSMGATRLNKPVVGMIRYGNGYLMVASDGGIFDFSNLPFVGSLGGSSIPSPIVSVTSPN
jgi:hypothetical protein